MTTDFFLQFNESFALKKETGCGCGKSSLVTEPPRLLVEVEMEPSRSAAVFIC